MSHLQVPAEAPFLVRAGADALLALHIGGGGVGMVSGAVALTARKGGPIHRAAGNVFFVAMMSMAGVGGLVAPFLADRVSTLAGFLTFYLVVTAWLTGRRRPGRIERLEMAAAIVPLTAIVLGLTFARMAAASPDGMLDGTPPQANYLFVTVGVIALAGDLHLMLRRGLAGAARIARHVWRMCVSLFIAAGSFFLGQQQVLPKAWHGSPLLFIPVLAPILAMLFWLGHTWWVGRRRHSATPAGA